MAQRVRRSWRLPGAPVALGSVSACKAKGAAHSMTGELSHIELGAVLAGAPGAALVSRAQAIASTLRMTKRTRSG